MSRVPVIPTTPVEMRARRDQLELEMQARNNELEATRNCIEELDLELDFNTYILVDELYDYYREEAEISQQSLINTLDIIYAHYTVVYQDDNDLTLDVFPEPDGDEFRSFFITIRNNKIVEIERRLNWWAR